MSFQARRLRVQLPCGEQTLVEAQAQAIRPTPTACPFATCGFVTPATCHPYHSIHPTTCVGYASCHFHTPITGTCDFVASTIATCNCSITFVDPCGGAGSGDPGTILIDPETLPQLREQLEAQLKEIEIAEQALKERKE